MKYGMLDTSSFMPYDNLQSDGYMSNIKKCFCQITVHWYPNNVALILSHINQCRIIGIPLNCNLM